MPTSVFPGNFEPWCKFSRKSSSVW